jgi:PAS domain S-box-containing protein
MNGINSRAQPVAPGGVQPRANHTTLWLRFVWLLITLLGALNTCAAEAQASPASSQHILLLYSYGYGGRGVELFSDGFFKAVMEAGFPVSQVYAEYLDLQRNSGVQGYREELADALRRKYAKRRIDLVITVQQPALEFLLVAAKDIALQAPVITVQQRPLLDEEKAGRRIVGEINRFDIKGTLERALELFPQTQRVVFASGSSKADIKLNEEAARVTAPWQGRLEFEYTNNKALDEILQRVGHLPPHSIIIFTQYNVDTKGRVALAYEVENMIVKAANAPVFGLYDFNLKNGGIGGSVIAVEASGARTARLAIDVLKGSPAEVLMLRENQNIPMFDWQQIQHWGGDESRLPANTVFVNRPPSEWDEHPEVIIASVIFILALLVVIAVLLINIRRRREAEIGLRQSEARFRAIFEDSLDGIVLVDPETKRFVSGNPALCRALGCKPEEITRLGVSDIHLQQDLPHVVDKFERQLRGEIQLATDVPVKRKDGSVFYADINSTAVNVSGKIYLLAIFRDVSERKQAEASLRESEMRFHDIVSASADWIWEVDNAARYTYVSPGITALLGYLPEEILGKTPFDLMLPEEAARVRPIFADIAAKGRPFRNLDNINLHKNGGLRYVLTNGMPIRDESGGVIGYRGLDVDVTEKKQAEIEILHWAEELRQRNDELERFNRATVGRELDMIALKHQINDLSRQCGQEPPYSLSFLDVSDKSGQGVAPA